MVIKFDCERRHPLEFVDCRKSGFRDRLPFRNSRSHGEQLMMPRDTTMRVPFPGRRTTLCDGIRKHMNTVL